MTDRERLLDELRPVSFAIAYRMLGSVSEAEDVVQEALLQVHEALEALSRADARLASVVEMRYFGGYSDAEIAEALDLTERTVQRDWVKARMLLRVLLDPA